LGSISPKRGKDSSYGYGRFKIKVGGI